MLCVMWNLFTVGSLQFPNDSAIASLEVNQNRPKKTALIFRKYLLVYASFLNFGII